MYDFAGKRFADLVSKLPNKGLPLVDDATCAISEYPENQASKPVKNMTGTSAGFDPGHRHFSPMLWLYPGVMTQPGQSRGAEQARDAGEEFMRIKTSGNGGHTSWSTVWSACIWARLQQAEPALDSLLRMLKKFSARNLLSLHPDLSPAADLPTCGTCFKEGAESQRRSSASTVGSGPNRGLTTAVNDKVSALHFIVLLDFIIIIKIYMASQLLVSTGRKYGLCSSDGRDVSTESSTGLFTIASCPAKFTIEGSRPRFTLSG